MDSYFKLASDFTSLHWWVSVVVVGILINLFSGGFQLFLGRFWKRFRVRTLANSKRARERFDRKINIYLHQPILMAMDGTLAAIGAFFGFSFAVAGALWLTGNAAYLLTVEGTLDEKMKGLQFFSIFGAAMLAGISLAFLNLSLHMLKPIVAARRIFVRDIESPNSEIDQNPPPDT